MSPEAKERKLVNEWISIFGEILNSIILELYTVAYSDLLVYLVSM